MNRAPEARSGRAVLAARLFLAGGVALCAAYLFLPRVAQPVVYLLLGGAAVVAMLRFNLRPGAPAQPSSGWLLLGLGMFATFGGDLTWTVYESLLGPNPVPSPAEPLYLGAYLLFIAGVLALLRGRETVQDRGPLVDAAIIAVGVGVVAWTLILQPYIADPGLGSLERAVALAYPVCDVVLLGVTARLVFSRARVRRSDLLLLGGFWLLLAADLFYAALLLGVGYDSGTALDLGWLGAYVLFGAAALHPSAAQTAGSEATGRTTLTPRRLVAMTIASLLAPVLLLTGPRFGAEVSVTVVGTGSMLLVLLVLARLAILLRHVEQQACALHRLVRRDDLTGAANRRALFEALPEALERAMRLAQPVSVALLDLDNFKEFNDANGHLRGDGFLRDAVAAWTAQLRDSDLLARYGGEEFAILLVDCQPDEALEAVERVRAVTPAAQSCSAGLAMWDGVEGPDELLARADIALYRAKRSGRDRTVLAASARAPGPAWPREDPAAQRAT